MCLSHMSAKKHQYEFITLGQDVLSGGAEEHSCEGRHAGSHWVETTAEYGKMHSIALPCLLSKKNGQVQRQQPSGWRYDKHLIWN